MARTEYFNNLVKAMSMLGDIERSLFIGQATQFPGTEMFHTIKHLKLDKRFELPVFENSQMGMSIGLSLMGLLPVSIFPRINFMLYAIGQLVNGIDKMHEYGNGWKPKVIIRTAVAKDKPMNPGIQHLGDYSLQIANMLEYTPVVRLTDPNQILPAYEEAVKRDTSTILVEYAELYDE